MYDYSRRGGLAGATLAAAILVAGCAAPRAPAPAAPVEIKCQPAAAGEPMAGNWLSVRTQKGVAGELRTLFTLNPDGVMAYTEQVKRPGKPSQGIEETGCWSRDAKGIILRTLRSNGEPVDASDPIYTNHYTIVSTSGDRLTLQGPQGLEQARRMSPGYRLPF
jgi:hypothetical protein